MAPHGGRCYLERKAYGRSRSTWISALPDQPAWADLTAINLNRARFEGGLAAAQAETFSGKVVQMKNAFGDLSEELGAIITKEAIEQSLIPALERAGARNVQLSPSVVRTS